MTGTGFVRIDWSQLNASFNQRQYAVREGNTDPFSYAADALVTSLETADALTALLPTLRTSETADAACGQCARAEAAARRLHVQLRDHTLPTSDAPVRTLGRCAWVALVRHQLLQQQAHETRTNLGGGGGGGAKKKKKNMPAPDQAYDIWPRSLLTHATDYAFVRNVAPRQNIVAATTLIGAYTLSQLFLAASMLVDALDAYGWQPSTGRYFQALYWRYALALHDPAGHAHHSEAMDSDFYAPDAADAVTVSRAEPLLAPARLTSGFLDVGERLFFHHVVWRDRCLRALVPPPSLQTPLSVPRVREAAAWRVATGLPALRAALVALLRHPMLRETVDGQIKTQFMARFVWPGERDTMRFEYGDDPDTRPERILYRLRVDQYARIKSVVDGTPLVALVERYVEASARMHGAAEVAGRRGVPGAGGDGTLGTWWEQPLIVSERLAIDERVVLLVAEVALNNAISAGTRGREQNAFSAAAYIDDRTLPVPLDRPPLTPESARVASAVAAARGRSAADRLTGPALPAWPTFLAVSGVYAVIPADAGAPMVVTPFLVDALGAWLATALDTTRGGGACLTPDVLRSTALEAWLALASYPLSE